MTELGWKSMGVLELTALPSIDQERWVPCARETDVLLVNGGDALYLCHWIRQSGLADLLPSLHETQTDALGQLVPANSRALEAEQLSANLFSFPLASRTSIVERDGDGLAPARVTATARLIDDINRGRQPDIRADGAYGVTKGYQDYLESVD